jgi:hypothetical protein
MRIIFDKSRIHMLNITVGYVDRNDCIAVTPLTDRPGNG